MWGAGGNTDLSPVHTGGGGLHHVKGGSVSCRDHGLRHHQLRIKLPCLGLQLLPRGRIWLVPRLRPRSLRGGGKCSVALQLLLADGGCVRALLLRDLLLRGVAEVAEALAQDVVPRVDELHAAVPVKVGLAEALDGPAMHRQLAQVLVVRQHLRGQGEGCTRAGRWAL